MPSPESLTNAIRGRATELGFDLVGFARAEAFASERELILEDLARGHLAGMSWITEERVRLSCEPSALLPEARSLLVLGTAYGGESPSAPETAGEKPQAPRGRVARYAWGRD